MRASTAIVISVATVILFGCVSEEKHPTPAERELQAQLAFEQEKKLAELKLAKEKRLAEQRQQLLEERRNALLLEMSKSVCTNTISRYLAAIRESYRHGCKYTNPFIREKQQTERKNKKAKVKNESTEKERKDWLSYWTSPRLEMSEQDALSGEELLASFGRKYLPTMFAEYEKKRESAVIIQQMFNEEFPQPWTINSTNARWGSFNKILEKFVRVRTELFIRHDELVHYWILKTFCVMDDKDLEVVDKQRPPVILLPERVRDDGFDVLNPITLKKEAADFFAKYAPDSAAAYQKLLQESRSLRAALVEFFADSRKIDAARYSRATAAAVRKYNAISRRISTVANEVQGWHTDYKMMEISSEEVAKRDSNLAKGLVPFIDSLQDYIKKHALGPIISDDEMVEVAGSQGRMENFRRLRFRMQRTEVTQLQWMLVMGSNPARFKGAHRPIEGFYWKDCQEFVRRLNVIDRKTYRIPTREEWLCACRANSKAEKGYGMRSNGECGPMSVMGWYCGNSKGHTHDVALKEPNAFGLYDMHGNVSECCMKDDDRIDVRGGYYGSEHWACECDHYDAHNDPPEGSDPKPPFSFSSFRGFRLASTIDVAM